MPKLSRWLKVSKDIPVFSHELSKQLSAMNVTFAGGEHTITQNVHVNSENKEKAIRLLEEDGFKIEEVDQH
ncbi:MAG: hypothetical protein JNL74_14925 [Fibrobacteres bacterium]|nr:hypothetical protein [Fibrobacterota bacterium]